MLVGVYPFTLGAESGMGLPLAVAYPSPPAGMGSVEPGKAI